MIRKVTIVMFEIYIHIYFLVVTIELVHVIYSLYYDEEFTRHADIIPRTHFT